MIDQITQFLINLAPAIVAATTVIIAAAKAIKSFKETSSEIKSDANIKSLVDENKRLRETNDALANELREEIRATRELRKSIEIQRTRKWNQITQSPYRKKQGFYT